MRIRQKLSQMYRLTLLLVMGAALSGCGQKGPLTLPTAPKAAPQNQTLPATKTPAASDLNDKRTNGNTDNSEVTSVEKNAEQPASLNTIASNSGQRQHQTAVIHAVTRAAQEG